MKTLITTIISACLMIGTLYAGEQTIFTELDEKKVNYISSDGTIYLMDDTDPRDVCEWSDKYSKNIHTVYNVKKLINAECDM